VTVADAAGLLLHSLLPAGVPIPPDEHARVSLLRSLAVDRRLLIVLDNASSAAQVRPLLVAGAGCRIIVTSRDALPGLVARDGASRVVLDVLSPSESVALLASFVDSPSSGLAELARRCAYLPLGLRVAGELVADGSLAPSFDDLDAGGDEETSLRAVFSWSYTRLPADAARAFRLLGAHPGREYDVYAVAALASLSLPDARALVRMLRRAHLLEERSPDRYTMHDLLHAYAVSLAAADSLAGAARARLVDYYIWCATAGAPAAARLRRPAIGRHRGPSAVSGADVDAARRGAGLAGHGARQPDRRGRLGRGGARAGHQPGQCDR
jgi:hypothetical protein